MAKSRCQRIIALICALGCLLFTACTESTVVPYEIPETLEHVASGVVAQNDRYQLEWDETVGCVLMRDRLTDRVWGTTPYEFYQTGEYDVDMLSALTIEYFDPDDTSLQVAYSYDAVEMYQSSSEKGENGIRVTYYFEIPQITVTLNYTLKDDSLAVTLNADDIVESGETRLIQVSLTPYLASTPNDATKTDYLFVPSGSGALMYTDTVLVGTPRTYEGEVYGKDLSRFVLDNIGDEEPIRLPIFGAKHGDNAMMGVITESAGAASIKASAGDSSTLYSNVYACFNVRNYTNIEWESGANKGILQAQDTILLETEFRKGQVFGVTYYPLDGEDANYSGMAKKYRRYLTEQGLLEKSDAQQQLYHLNIIGGAEQKQFFLGIPYDSLVALTTFEQAQSIVSSIKDLTGTVPHVTLKGFGQSGIDVNKIGGGFTFAGLLNKNNAQKALEQYCKENNVPLFTDFDLVQFNAGGNGFSVTADGAMTSNDEKVYFYPIKRNIRDADKTRKAIYLLERQSLMDAVTKMNEFAKDRISGISFSTLGTLAYSDAQDKEQPYILKNGWVEQMKEIMAAVNEAGHTVVISAANDYAAGLTDGVYDAPLQNGEYLALDATIPFYEMVYGGYVPLYSDPLNLANNYDDLLLRAVEAGVSPSYTVSQNLDPVLADSPHSIYYGILYETNSANIKETAERTAAYYESIRGASIASHTILQEGVTETVFENGVTVLVNHTDADVVVNDKTVAARSFIY